MIAPEKLLEAAKALEPQLQEWRRTLHRHPEVGFDLPQTKALVKKALTEMGYTPQDCGKCGVVTLAGGKRPGKVILLRGDMDALPLQEESGEEFSSELPGKMHGCGHDMHTAMVLGAAKLLKEHEDEIEGTVKLEFQPAEEIFQGSLDMINSGLLENPKVDAAVMFHVLAGMPLPAGMVLVPGGGITMASCEQYHIVVHGKGGHGSMPNACIDPITAAAHIHIALQEINSRELDPAGFGVFTTGRFEAGKASNIIPDTADMWGTIRTVDPEQKVSALIHQRMTEIAQGVATAYRCTAEVEFSDYCPCMVVDTPLAGNALTYMTELLGKGAMDMTPLTGGKPREQGTLRLHAVREPRQQARPGFLLRIFHSRQCGAPMDVRLGQAGGSQRGQDAEFLDGPYTGAVLPRIGSVRTVAQGKVGSSFQQGKQVTLARITTAAIPGGHQS